MDLNQQQKEMLIFLGSPSKGSALHVLDERVFEELVALGLLHRGATPVPYLTDAGEREHRKLIEAVPG